MPCPSCKASLDALADARCRGAANTPPSGSVRGSKRRSVGARRWASTTCCCACDAALQAEGGERLAALIREQFPVALIDEFQDTDPVQYRHLRKHLSASNDNDPETGLFLIGDPKQAIYAFRGADIYTYLRARQATTGRLHTLGTNFRSSHGMVEAVNHVFERSRVTRGRGEGAFLFRERTTTTRCRSSPVRCPRPQRASAAWRRRVSQR